MTVETAGYCKCQGRQLSSPACCNGPQGCNLRQMAIFNLSGQTPFAADSRIVGESAHRVLAVCEKQVEMAGEPFFMPLFSIVAISVFFFFAMFFSVIFMTFATLAAPLRMLLLISISHPLFLHKVDRLAAGVVTGTVLAPFFLMPWRHVQVNWLALHHNRGRQDDHRLRIHQHGRRVVADIDPSIDARLVDVNRHANPGLGKYGTCGPSQGNNGDSGNFLHGDLSKYAHL